MTIIWDFSARLTAVYLFLNAQCCKKVGRRWKITKKTQENNTTIDICHIFGSVRSPRNAILRLLVCLSDEECFRAQNIHLSLSSQS